MENATKALLIAAGILLGILIIGAMVFTMTALSSVKDTDEKSLKQEQIVEFNKQYESYVKKKLRGVEVISAINRAINNNKKYEGISDRQIEVKVEITKDNRGYGVNKDDTGSDNLNIGTYIFTNANRAEFDTLVNNKDSVHSFMYSRNFNCNYVGYHSNSGLVSELFFVEI